MKLTDVTLDYEKVIDYYSLRFQIEFVFRDAKQYWGMEDSMNIKKIPIHNWANLYFYGQFLSWITPKF
ncbi:MAG: hypothetical protein Q9M36_03905 [Sulfurovum sp.]|nr:hypothetical protein [Sulfurovum sp.]